MYVDRRGTQEKDIYLLCGMCTEAALLRDPNIRAAPFYAGGMDAPPGFVSKSDFERHLRAQHCWPKGGKPEPQAQLRLQIRQMVAHHSDHEAQAEADAEDAVVLRDETARLSSQVASLEAQLMEERRAREEADGGTRPNQT